MEDGVKRVLIGTVPGRWEPAADVMVRSAQYCIGDDAMNVNVGSTDRTVRIVLGAILVLAGIGGYAGLVPLAWIGIGQALAAVVAAVVGLILLATGLSRTCLIYQVFGVSTAR